MTATLEQCELVWLIRLEGDINITGAAELKTLLLEALASGKELRVDLEPAAEMDITGLQLLWAAAQKAHGSGTGFTLAGQVPKSILDATLDAGLETFPVPEDQETSNGTR